MSKTVKELAEEIGVSKQAVFKKMKREPLSTSLRGLTTTVDGRLMVSVDGEKLIKQAFSKDNTLVTEDNISTTINRLTVEVDGEVDESSTKIEVNNNEVDGEVDDKNRLYEILERELEAKNEQIAALQNELSKERQHSREQAERIAVLADQAQRLQLAQMSPLIKEGESIPETEPASTPEPEIDPIKKSWWQRLFK